MPRRPVKPQDRRRVLRACDPCKASKKRCDGCQPCNSCSQKRRDDICHYTTGRRHSLRRQSSAPSQQVQVGLSQTTSETVVSPNSFWNAQNPCNISPASINSNFAHELGEHGSKDSRDDDICETSSEEMEQPSVMLSSVNGEKVFIGNTAAISFLRFLQRTLKRHIGSSCFTETQESRRLFEADTTNIGSSYFFDRLSICERKTHIQYFLDASSGLLDMYSLEEIDELLETQNSSSCATAEQTTVQRLSNLQTASLYLMVAIGAQCYNSNTDDGVSVAELFSYARKLALEQMLENPSVELVRAFLLMAFYMFGACRRNSAFMYLGVASKAADILGLHMSAQYKHLAPTLRNARLRTAKSLRVFDVICNSILGRRGSTSCIQSGYNTYVSEDDTTSWHNKYRALALGAIYDVAAILDVAVTKSADTGLEAEAAEGFVVALQQCSRDFPPVLRRSDNEKDYDIRHVTIGNVHVSGTYYFSVIVVTREFLIQHVVPKLSGQTQVSLERQGDQQQIPMKEAKIAELANACVDAATFMAQMCYEVMRSGQLAGNMCILKAWIFATGLVLGFALLVDDEKDSLERRNSFLKSLHVLSHLKHLSPQAGQYHDILSSFHIAIKSYKEQLYRERRVSQTDLVDRIYQPTTAEDFVAEPEVIPTQLPSPEITVPDMSSTDWTNEMSLGGLDDATPIDPTQMGQNDIIMRMLWESDRYAMDCPGSMLNNIGINLDHLL